MAICTVQDLIDLASSNGFTKLSHGDKLSVECQLLKTLAGSTDNAEALLEAAKDSGFTIPSYGCKLSIKLELLCNYAGSSLDEAVQSFITRAQISDINQIGALNNLVVGLKADGLWSKFYALYPFVGGTANAHAQNLASTSHTIDWRGTLTHDANGVTGDGNTGYGISLTPSEVWSTNEDAHMYLYRRSTSTATQIMMGVNDGTGIAYLSQAVTNNIAGIIFGGAGPNSLSGTFDGHFMVDRTTGPESYLINNERVSTVSTGAAVALVTIPIYILGYNIEGSLSVPSKANLGMASLGLHMSSAERAAYFSRVETFQSALSRKV